MDLTALQHSAFLQSLGWAIANSLWQAAILWGLFQLINAAYRDASARFKSNSATIFLFSTFTWFMVTFVVKFLSLSNGGQKTLLLSPEQLVQLNEYLNQPGNFINWDQLMTDASAALPFLSVAYLLLLIVFCSRWISAFRHTTFIRTNGLQKPGVEWRLFTDKSAMHIGIHKKIRIWFSKHIDVPATMGYLKPVILIPLASLNQLTTEQLEAIILHELAHIKRNDYLLNLFISIIETIMFFNPFVVLLAKMLKRERENCCDDFVIQYQYDRHSYASALLSIERYRLQQHNLAMSATSGKKQLLVRVRRIMENNQNQHGLNYGQKLTALLIVTGMILSLAWLSPSDTTVITTKKGETPALMPSINGQRLATLSKKENIVEELANLSLSTKQLKEISITIQKQAPKIIEQVLKEFPKSVNIKNLELKKNDQLLALNKLNKLNWSTNNITTAAASLDEQLNEQLSLLPAHGQKALESYFNKVSSSAVDAKSIEQAISKARIELAKVDWKKVEVDIQDCLDNVQKELEKAPLELRKLMAPSPSTRLLKESEFKKDAEVKRLMKVRTELSRLRRVPSADYYVTKSDSIRLVKIPGSRTYRHHTSEPPVLEDDDPRMYAFTSAAPTAPVEYKSVYAAPNTYTFKMDNTYDYGSQEVVEIHGTSGKKFKIEYKEGFLYINGDRINVKDIKPMGSAQGTRIRAVINTTISVSTSNCEKVVSSCEKSKNPTKSRKTTP